MSVTMSDTVNPLSLDKMFEQLITTSIQRAVEANNEANTKLFKSVLEKHQNGNTAKQTYTEEQIMLIGRAAIAIIETSNDPQFVHELTSQLRTLMIAGFQVQVSKITNNFKANQQQRVNELNNSQPLKALPTLDEGSDTKLDIDPKEPDLDPEAEPENTDNSEEASDQLQAKPMQVVDEEGLSVNPDL